MTALLPFAAFVWFLMASVVSARGLTGEGATPPTAGDVAQDRAAQVAVRYRAMLEKNPTEGMALDRLWKYHEEHGSTADLIESYRQAAEKADADTATLLIYGHLLKKVGRLEEASKWYNQAAERAPADPLPTMALATLAEQRGDHEQAANLYGEVLGKLRDGDRSRAEILLKRGNALLASGKVADASESWEKMVALNPGDLAVRRQLADLYEKNGLLDRAVEHYAFIEAHAGPADRAAALRELGRLQEARGQFEAARDALERGLTLTARDNWLHGELQARLIRLYQRAGRVPELAARWREAVEQAPRDLGRYFRLEALAEAEGDVSAECGWLEKIVALAPGDRDSVLKLAVRLADAGELPRAAALYDGLLQRQPGQLELILARSELDLRLGENARAVRRVEARVAESPLDESVTNPALSFFLTHHLAEAAEKLLRAAVQKQPAAPEPSLALAKFLFTQRRTVEAGAVLNALVDQPGDDVVRASRFGLAAEAFKDGGMPEEAMRCWREASRVRPEDPVPLLAAAEALRAAGDLSRSAELLQRAVSVSPAGPEQINIEKKMFDTLRSVAGTDQPGTPGINGLDSGPGTQRRASDSLLGKYLSGLEEQAKQERTAASYLRLARWYWWMHDAPRALATADKALAVDPGNIAARELVVSIASETHQPALAERRLTEIQTLEPAKESDVLRQLARLKMEGGDQETALKIYTRLQQLSPGSRTALSDRALAQQRADRWYDALASWEQAYQLPGSTPAQRAEIRRPLLSAYEHLAQFTRAMEVLLQAVDEQADASAKEDLFRQAAELAYKNNLGTALTAQFQERLQTKPDDYFTLTALAQLKREAAEPEEAYRLSQKAYYGAPDPARSLSALIQEAEALGRTDEAIGHLARLTALPGQYTAENLVKLAELQEENQDPVATELAWNTLVARFPRDATALGKAADYFERSEQLTRARELQRRLVALDGTDLPRVLHLAALDIKSGDVATALGDYETVLAGTQPEIPGAALLPPDELTLSDSVRSSSLTSGARLRIRVLGGAAPVAKLTPKPAVGDQACRLQAIEEVSRLLFLERESQPPTLTGAQKAWLARWQSAAEAGLRTEPLRAFYAARQKDATMALLSKWMGPSQPDDSLVRNAFLAAGLRLGDYQSVGQWAWNESGNVGGERAQAMLGALDEYLSAGGKPGPTIADGLFPSGVTRKDASGMPPRSLRRSTGTQSQEISDKGSSISLQPVGHLTRRR